VKPDPNQLGGWYWESGFDHDPITEMEAVRDWNFRAMYGDWDTLKNVDKVFPNHTLNWSAHILGKRESRRLLGDVILTLDDLEKDRQFPDGAVPTGWSNDLHLPDPKYDNGFEGDAFISRANFGEFPAHRAGRPFWIPYRCLYSRNMANLFMAGRDLSVAHEALGAVRVMRTGGCMGEIVGMAASLCKKHDATPRGIYERYWGELQELMRRGVGKNPGANPAYENGGEPRAKPSAKLLEPVWKKEDGPNLARTARVTLTSGKSGATNSTTLLTDGRINLADNNSRWMSVGPLPHGLEFAWEKPVTIGAARIVSGYNTKNGVVGAIGDFVLQWRDGSAWRDVDGAKATANTDPFWNGIFAPVTTERVRLRITRSQGDTSRIWEVEFYGAVKAPPP